MTSPYRLGGVAVAGAALVTVLGALAGLLLLPSGYGIEDWLGLVDARTIVEMGKLWRLQLPPPWDERLPAVYLGLDTASFMPLYALFLAGAWYESRLLLRRHSSREGDWGRWLTDVGAVLLAGLLLVDLLENVVGLQRLAPDGAAWIVSLVAFVLTLLGLHFFVDRAWLSDVAGSVCPPSRFWPARRWPSAVAIVASAAALLTIWDHFFPSAACRDAGDLVLRAACTGHRLKSSLAAALCAGPLSILLWVLFGPHADKDRWADIVATRRAMAGTVWRTRYVLVAIGAAFALLLVMDQGQDVIYAMASHPWSEQDKAVASLQTVLVLGATAVAMWIFGFTCWLWARLGVLVAESGAALRSPELRYEDVFARIWARALGVPVPEPVAPRGPEPRAEDAFARNWARVLGVLPAALVVVLALRTLPRAVVLHEKGPIGVLLVFAILVLVGGVAFVWWRDRASAVRIATGGTQTYYACVPLAAVIETAARHRLFGWVTPFGLPVLTLVLGQTFKGIAVLAPAAWQLPTLTLPIVLCLLAFWLTLAGWISLYEHSESVPWLLFGIVWIGVLGMLGQAENHRIPLDDNGVSGHPVLAFACSVAAALVLLGCVTFLLCEMRSGKARQWVAWTCVGVLLSGESVVMLSANYLLDRTRDVQASASPIDAASALSAWLEDLCASPAGTTCAPERPTPVYVVAAEGGGLRSAYWTALALQRLAATDARFERRTFAASGVSGGALGLAVYRACRADALDRTAAPTDASQATRDCVERFGRADLLAPLVGAWFFEDALARWLPLSWCSTPGCGFLSRGLWFEQAMSANVGSRDAQRPLEWGLVESRDRVVSASQQHTPYLLLNSTLVETGERVVASELIVDWREHFPGALDEAAMLGQPDIGLVAAAHNSSRFPFTNALGGLHAPPDRCTPDAYQARQKAASGPAARCGHLADGGYFDNGAAQTTNDLLRLMRACLSDWTSRESAACPGLSTGQRQALAQALEVNIVLVRNGTPARRSEAASCAPADPPQAADLRFLPASADLSALSRPSCAKNARLYVDFLGPIITAFNAIGTGSNGRLAVARVPAQGLAAEAILPVDPATLPFQHGRIPAFVVRPFDLTDDGPLFPLGWHLAASARTEMNERADCEARRFFADRHGAAVDSDCGLRRP